MMKRKEIRAKVLRKGSSNGERYETWRVPWSEGMSVLNVLQYINENYGVGLAYYACCRIGICQGCFARVNGKPVKICTEIVKGDFSIEPLKGYPVVKDLVVGRSRKKNTGNTCVQG